MASCRVRMRLVSTFVFVAVFVVTAGVAAGGEQPLACRVETPGIWLRIQGIRFEAPFTISITDSVVFLDDRSFVVATTRLPPAEAIQRRDCWPSDIYQYGRQLVKEIVDGGRKPTDAEIAAVDSTLNFLLREHGYPEVGVSYVSSTPPYLVLTSPAKYGGIGQDQCRVPLDSGRRWTAAERARSGFQSAAGYLARGQCVSWGLTYLDSYFTSEDAAAVDHAIQQWIGDEHTVDDSISFVTRDHDVDGVRVPGALLWDAMKSAGRK